MTAYAPSMPKLTLEDSPKPDLHYHRRSDRDPAFIDREQRGRSYEDPEEDALKKGPDPDSPERLPGKRSTDKKQCRG